MMQHTPFHDSIEFWNRLDDTVIIQQVFLFVYVYVCVCAGHFPTGIFICVYVYVCVCAGHFPTGACIQMFRSQAHTRTHPLRPARSI